MLTTDTTLMLANYSKWANQVLFKAIEALPEGAVYQSRPMIFGSMIGTLNHNYQVDLIWRANLLGEQHGFTSRRDLLHPELDALVAAQSEIDQWYIDWAKSQDSETLSERLQFKFISGQAAQMARGAMFLHVINHKTFHRGWVSEMFFDIGARPPATDLPVYLCEG